PVRCVAAELERLPELLERDDVASVRSSLARADARQEIRIGEHGQRLLEALQIIRTDQHRDRLPVARDDDPVLLARDAIDELREPGLDRGEREDIWHDQNQSHDRPAWGQASAQLAAAVATASPNRRRTRTVARLEGPATDGAAGGAIGRKALPDLDEQFVERRPAGLALIPPPQHRRRCWSLDQRQRAHDPLRYSPTTRPRVGTSL